LWKLFVSHGTGAAARAEEERRAAAGGGGGGGRMSMDSGELDRIIRKLNEAKAISEWHFRDAVEELIVSGERPPYDFLNDDL
jgi:hypothetical protein